MSSKNTGAFIMLLQQVNEINKNIVTPEVTLKRLLKIK